MPAPLSIRTDRDAAELRRLARRERDGRVSARLLMAAAEALPATDRAFVERLLDNVPCAPGAVHTCTTAS